eukprot:3941273-Rhodomonas_salina.1
MSCTGGDYAATLRSYAHPTRCSALLLNAATNLGYPATDVGYPFTDIGDAATDVGYPATGVDYPATDIGYAATRSAARSIPLPPLLSDPQALRSRLCCYVECGTDLGYAATPCAVLT